MRREVTNRLRISQSIPIPILQHASPREKSKPLLFRLSTLPSYTLHAQLPSNIDSHTAVGSVRRRTVVPVAATRASDVEKRAKTPW